MEYTHPILSCAEAQSYEQELLNGDAVAEWSAMRQAGCAIGRAIIRDFLEIAPLPNTLRVLVLCGKGHNGGDALLAALEIVACQPQSRIEVITVDKPENLRPNVQKALHRLEKSKAKRRVAVRQWSAVSQTDDRDYDICIDGLLGIQFKPPLRQNIKEMIEWANRLEQVRLRAAVDLPSGIGDSAETVSTVSTDVLPDGAFRADFTYAPGICKKPIFASENADWVGRVRYLDIGFFENKTDDGSRPSVLLNSVLEPLRKLRQAQSDKRSYGHLFLMGGSRRMPGAIQMAVRAAVNSGAGLVTAFVGESMATAFSTVLAESMWVPWSEDKEGHLSVADFDLLKQHLKEDSVLVVGPGMGRTAGVLELLLRVVGEALSPLVLDADALLPEVLDAVKNRPAGAGRVVITPHAGEFQRLGSDVGLVVDDQTLKKFCREYGVITVLKGAHTRISDGERVVTSPFGGPVLARGGSGDILSGLVGSQLGRFKTDPMAATCRAVAWHGLAAEALARARGQEAVHTTEIIDYLSNALRE